ncbi:hypothetical protein DP939_12165 [Spongiactinospora rosea]|uniref:Uncharacterized protein n=1 Tax=Spongiactinospora rosea TaxID=2248750 RepID=A0A366M252_9ACTN|nr:hypothetical protein DP939_12165 [Spongiactinospora rosea]
MAASATAMLTASLLMVSTSPAQAAPTNCSRWQSGYWAYSKCTSGTGTHSVTAYGQHVNPWNGPWAVEGPRVGVGETSAVNFPGTIQQVYVNLYD